MCDPPVSDIAGRTGARPAAGHIAAADPVHWVLQVEHGVEGVRERLGEQKTTGHPLTILLTATGGKWIDGPDHRPAGLEVTEPGFHQRESRRRY